MAVANLSLVTWGTLKRYLARGLDEFLISSWLYLLSWDHDA